MPPVRRFWVIVANLPPPVPRKMSSSGEAVVIGVFRPMLSCRVWLVNVFSFRCWWGVSFIFLVVCLGVGCWPGWC